MENTEQNIYEKMPWKEQRQLRKEYFRSVNPRARIFKWISLGLMLPFFAVAGRTGYNFFLLLTDKPVSWFLTWNYVFMLSALIIMCLAMYGEKSFTKWLWKDKKILSREWKSKNLELVNKSYKELSKQEKQKLRKEYFNGIGKSSRYWSIAIILVFGVLMYAVFEIFFYWHWQILVSRSIGIIAFTGYILFVYKGLLFAKYWQWLEYEKGITNG